MGEASSEEIKARVAAAFDRASGTYDQVGTEYFAPAGRFLVSRTAPQPGERVLDVGCGRGASAIPAAHAVGASGSVLATDLAVSMVESVRRASKAMPWLRVEVGDAEHPPPGPFNVVQAGLVLFFLPSLDAALSRYRTALTRPGRLGFTWPGALDAPQEAVFNALEADLPESDQPLDDGPFESPAAMHTYLTEQGWSDPTTETRVHLVRLSDADHWFEWSWSHGYRRLLEELQEQGLLTAARERATPLIDKMIADEGGLVWPMEVHATVVHV